MKYKPKQLTHTMADAFLAAERIRLQKAFNTKATNSDCRLTVDKLREARRLIMEGEPFVEYAPPVVGE